jgi:hypothetical protein
LNKKNKLVASDVLILKHTTKLKWTKQHGIDIKLDAQPAEWTRYA